MENKGGNNPTDQKENTFQVAYTTSEMEQHLVKSFKREGWEVGATSDEGKTKDGKPIVSVAFVKEKKKKGR